jgi:hypothetical protein
MANKRNAKGGGQIRKRNNGNWEGRFSCGYDENGKQIGNWN